MRDVYQDNLLKIVRSALTGEAFEISDEFDFKRAIKDAHKHQIAGIVYYGALNCGISPETEEMQELFLSVCKHIMIMQRQKYQINLITKAFENNNIDYMLLKGSNLRDLYPKPEMRIMGDVDILIKTDQYDRIRNVMSELGLNELDESDHELIWQNQNVMVELHKRLIPSYNKDYYAYYGDGWRLAKQSDRNKNCFVLSPEDEMIYIFTHFAKHYRDAGVGIRHIVDVWVFSNAHPELDLNYIFKELKKLQLDEFYKNIMYTFAVWFCNARPNAKTDLITKVILNSRAYGTRESHLLSDAVKRSKSVSVKLARLQKILNMVFTPYGSLSDLYPILKKIPILLPFAWVYHWFDVALNRRSNIAKRNMERKIISEDNIIDYQEDLKSVGLDFNFK